jgi:ribonuclease G
MPKELLINSTTSEIRVAVLEDGILAEVFVERRKNRGIVGNIYKGRVTKVLPGMQSAFVDIGLDKDAFLYVADVSEDLEEFEAFGSFEDDLPEEPPPAEGSEAGGRSRRGPLPSIDDLLRESQEILVQVVKETIAGKGARITTHVTLPGRYLVYMPSVKHIGVSRRIENDAERERLKKILGDMVAQKKGGGGFIVRTAGEGRGEEEFSADRKYLTRLWDQIRKRSEKAGAPSLVHRDLDLVLRVVRDVFSADFATLWVDSVEEYQRVVEFLDQIQPDRVSKVRLYRKSFPLFEEFGVEGEIEKALRPKVWLKSGGYIVINQTEALVSIDVNTGKFVGRKRLEDTVFKTNLEAVREIVRQLRLRDLGGIIVVDFIDMEEEENKKTLVASLEEELKKDRSKTKFLGLSEFGLVEITRKRTKPSLERALTRACPYCDGTGRIKSDETICSEIRREILKLPDVAAGQELLVRVHPDVFKALHGSESGLLEVIEEDLGITILLKADESLHHEQFDAARL